MLQQPASECAALVKMAYDELMGRRVTSYGQGKHLEELRTQKNLLVACLYVTGFGYYLSSQWVGATSSPSTWPDKDEAHAWKSVVYPTRKQNRWHAEDMACILAEMHMNQINKPLQKKEKYPKGSLVRIYRRYGVEGIPGPITPCTAENSNRIDAPCETTIYYLGIGTTQYPDPPRDYSLDAEELEELQETSKHYKR
jgi:hypothetical protein